MATVRRTIYQTVALIVIYFALYLFPVEANSGSWEIVFIDSSVQDAQVLVDGIRPGVEVVRLEAGRDGVA